MKILLTNPPCYGNDWHLIRAGCRWPFIFNTPKPTPKSMGNYNTYPFFMGYATTYLADVVRVGEVHFYDALALNDTYETFYKTVSDLKPDIVLFETSTPSIENDMAIAKYIKENIGCEVALAGSHATVYAEELIKHDFVDYILKGEYEVGAYEMCLMRKKGIYECKPLKNIEFMPIRGEFCYLYGDGMGQPEKFKFPQLQVWTSRGCPFNCSFCLWRNTMTFGNYRQRSVRSILREITGCMKNYHFKSVLLDDDTVNVGDERTIEISKAMGLIDIEWQAMVRADSCSWNAFEEMKRNGCTGLKLGIESFSQTGLDFVDKKYKSEKIVNTLDFLVSCGFHLFISLMDNIPNETEKDKEETKKWLKHFTDLGVKFQHPNCMPLPGTKLFNSLENKLTKNWLDYGKFHGEVFK